MAILDALTGLYINAMHEISHPDHHGTRGYNIYFSNDTSIKVWHWKDRPNPEYTHYSKLYTHLKRGKPRSTPSGGTTPPKPPRPESPSPPRTPHPEPRHEPRLRKNIGLLAVFILSLVIPLRIEDGSSKPTWGAYKHARPGKDPTTPPHTMHAKRTRDTAATRLKHPFRIYTRKR